MDSDALCPFEGAGPYGSDFVPFAVVFHLSGDADSFATGLHHDSGMQVVTNSVRNAATLEFRRAAPRYREGVGPARCNQGDEHGDNEGNALHGWSSKLVRKSLQTR